MDNNNKEAIVKAILKIDKLDEETLRELLIYALLSIDPTVILESMKQVLIPEQVKEKDEAVEPRGKEICIVVPGYGETFWTEGELSQVRSAYNGTVGWEGKIPAIKEVRIIKGFNLRDGKAVVEAMMDQGIL